MSKQAQQAQALVDWTAVLFDKNATFAGLGCFMAREGSRHIAVPWYERRLADDAPEIHDQCRV